MRGEYDVHGHLVRVDLVRDGKHLVALRESWPGADMHWQLYVDGIDRGWMGPASPDDRLGAIRNRVTWHLRQ